MAVQTGKKFRGIDTAAREIISTLMNVAETNPQGKFLHRGLKYLTPNLVVKGTVRGRLDKRDSRVEILITAGSPNCRERDYIKLCRGAKVAFPVRRIQLEYRMPRVRKIKGRTKKL